MVFWCRPFIRFLFYGHAFRILSKTSLPPKLQRSSPTFSSGSFTFLVFMFGSITCFRASQVEPEVENLPSEAGDKRWEFNPCFRKIPWRRSWQPTPIFLPGESHGQRSLAGYSTWGRKESDTTLHACTVHRIEYGSKFIISFGMWMSRSLSTIWWKDSPFPVDPS